MERPDTTYVIDEMTRAMDGATVALKNLADSYNVRWDSIGEVGFWAAERAAKSVSNSYPRIEEDDAFQEALIYLATHPDEMSKQYEYGVSLPGIRGGEQGGRKAVAMQLISRLREWARSQTMNQDRELEAAMKVEEKVDLGRWANRPTPPGFEGMAYTPALVETILPLLWHEHLIAGMQTERQPAPDMPKAASNPKLSGTHMAHYVDIKDAWIHAPLTWEQRSALFHSIGLGWTQEQIAGAVAMSQRGIGKRIDRAIETIATYLNGKAVALGGDQD
jgi:hypothetical protein